LNKATLYDSYDWNNLSSEQLRLKLDWLFKTIPPEVISILDVGCGNGFITNELAKTFQVTGLDISEKSLQSVNAEKVCASSSAIPFANHSFDLVLASEILEHLTEEDFIKTLKELKRVTKKYIIIGVPNAENLDKTLIECEQCKFRYNRSYHLRSFDKNRLQLLFSDYKIVAYTELGNKVRTYNSFLSKIKHLFSPAISWIPYYWTALEKRKTTCPKCSFSFEYKYRFHFVSFFLDSLNAFISKKKPYWIMVLFSHE
jgi:ubiquinone/menaquinone biosynthesis C-methylase UbiE